MDGRVPQGHSSIMNHAVDMAEESQRRLDSTLQLLEVGKIEREDAYVGTGAAFPPDLLERIRPACREDQLRARPMEDERQGLSDTGLSTRDPDDFAGKRLLGHSALRAGEGSGCQDAADTLLFANI